MHKVVWTDKCLDRIDEITEYIELDSLKNAFEFASSVFSKEELLKNNPRIGRVVPDYEIEEYRQILVGNYRLIYQIENKTIYMLTIRHCRQEKILDP